VKLFTGKLVNASQPQPPNPLSRNAFAARITTVFVWPDMGLLR
jgi:hypothetical protein